MIDTVNLHPTENSISEGSDIPPMAPTIFNTGRGPVLAMDWPGICSIGMMREGSETSTVAVMIYDPRPVLGHEGPGTAALSQMTAEQARNFGASLIELADQIDGGSRQ